jgi:DNA polymerase (family 10)
MPVHNTDIDRIFNQIADLLEIDNASPFRVRCGLTAMSLALSRTSRKA